MKTFGIIAAIVLVQTAALADSISSPDAAFVAVPLAFQSTTGANGSQGAPFWNHNSLDGVGMNAGYFLTGTNPNLGTTDYLSSTGGFGNYLSTGNSVMDASTNFSFLQSAVTVNVTLLYSNAGANMTSQYGTQIGLYNVDDPSQRQVLFAHGTLYNSANPTGVFNNNVDPQPTITVNTFANYGVYAQTCGFNANWTIYCDTHFSNASLDQTTEALHQHFALFQSGQDPKSFFVGYEDIRGLTDTTEGYGDYNDVIFKIQTATHMPEPATWSAMALGLLGIVVLRRRATQSAKTN